MFDRKNLLSVLFTVLFVAGCGGSSGGSGDTESFIDQNSELATSVINNYVDDVVIATYAELEEDATKLVEAIEAIEGGGQAEIDAAKQAWIEARVPWEQSEAWLFGPVEQKGHDPALDSWPVNRTDLDNVLNSVERFPEAFIRAGLAPEVKGFHTVEYLLWEKSSLISAAGKELRYLTAIAKNIQSVAEELHTDWTEGDEENDAYDDVMKNAGVAGATFSAYETSYPSKLSAIEEIIAGMSIILDEVANGKIADPYDEEDVQKVESQFSFNSRADFAHDIVGVLNVYLGCRVPVPDNLMNLSAADRTCDADGLDDLIAQSDSALAERVENEINAAIDAILAISQPFRDAITDPSQADEIEAAQEAINDVFSTLNGPVLTLVRQ